MEIHLNILFTFIQIILPILYSLAILQYTKFVKLSIHENRSLQITITTIAMPTKVIGCKQC